MYIWIPLSFSSLDSISQKKRNNVLRYETIRIVHTRRAVIYTRIACHFKYNILEVTCLDLGPDKMGFHIKINNDPISTCHFQSNNFYSFNRFDVIIIQSTFDEILLNPNTQPPQRQHSLFVSIKIRTTALIRILRIWNPVATMAQIYKVEILETEHQRTTHKDSFRPMSTQTDGHYSIEGTRPKRDTTAIMLYVCTGWSQSTCDGS